MSLPLYQGSSTPLPWAGVLVHTCPFAAPLGATIDVMSMTSSTHGLNFSRHGGCMWRETIVNSQDSAKPHGPSTTTTYVRRFATLHSWRPSHMAAMWSRPSEIHLEGSRTERGQNQLNHSRWNISHSSLFCEPFLLPFCEPLWHRWDELQLVSCSSSSHAFPPACARIMYIHHIKTVGVSDQV